MISEGREEARAAPELQSFARLCLLEIKKNAQELV